MFALTPWRKERNFGTLTPRVDAPFRLMRDEFENFFNRMFGNFPTMWDNEWPMPWGIDAEEKEKETVVRMELPGFEPSEVNVTAAGETLTVEAEHKEDKFENKENFLKEEGEEGNGEKPDRSFGRRYAHVRRSITLPAGTDVSKIDASYKNGVLELHLPKTPETESRRIEIKA